MQAEQTATDVHCGYLSILFCCQYFSHFLGLADRPQAGGSPCSFSVTICHHPAPWIVENISLLSLTSFSL